NRRDFAHVAIVSKKKPAKIAPRRLDPVRLKPDTTYCPVSSSCLEPHLERETNDAALQNALYLAERRADRIVPREDGIAVQRVEQIHLAAECLAAHAEVLLEVQVELVVARVVQRARRVHDDRLRVRAPAGEQGRC